MRGRGCKRKRAQTHANARELQHTKRTQHTRAHPRADTREHTHNQGVAYSEELRRELVAAVRSTIGAFAAPDVIHWAPGLPKTRSGKIMRRILRKIAENDVGSLGDTSTLADPTVVDALIDSRPSAG